MALISLSLNFLMTLWQPDLRTLLFSQLQALSSSCRIFSLDETQMKHRQIIRINVYKTVFHHNMFAIRFVFHVRTTQIVLVRRT